MPSRRRPTEGSSPPPLHPYNSPELPHSLLFSGSSQAAAMATALHALREAAKDTAVFLVDHQGVFGEMAAQRGGATLHLGKPGQGINPFLWSYNPEYTYRDLYDALTPKSQVLENLIHAISRGTLDNDPSSVIPTTLAHHQAAQAQLGRRIIGTDGLLGYCRHLERENTESEYSVLFRSRRDTMTHAESTSKLANSLRHFLSSPESDLLDAPAEIPAFSGLTTFDLSQLPQAHHPLAVALAAAAASDHAMERRPTALIFPEVRAITTSTLAAAVLPPILRRRGTLSLTAATGEPIPLLADSGNEPETAAQRRIIAHCPVMLTLRVPPEAALHVARAMNLPPHLEATLPALPDNEMVTSLNRECHSRTGLSPTPRELRLLKLIQSHWNQGEER